ncbi:PadR family transcriptional regulator [Halalkalibacter sp. AB-rgal2]|uniref:PadR family transcriptional regulator n=1 Tax=Halalkalibacter sp. AB-rgal2 TaxID=3242695 RepID=UPI00359CF652
MSKENYTKYVILGLLTTHCRSGYSMKKMIDTSLNYFWKVSYGQIYPMLKVLVDEGLAEESDVVDDGSKREKKEYSITKKGQEELRDWLQRPIVSIPVEKNELLLKLFFSRNVEKNYSIEQLSSYLHLHKERFAVYQTIEKMIQSYSTGLDDEHYWLITLDYGKRTTNAVIEWCEETIRTLSKS